VVVVETAVEGGRSGWILLKPCGLRVAAKSSDNDSSHQWPVIPVDRAEGQQQRERMTSSPAMPCHWDSSNASTYYSALTIRMSTLLRL
jgi:hypothetical protein